MTSKEKLIDEILDYVDSQSCNKEFIAITEICYKYDERYNKDAIKD